MAPRVETMAYTNDLPWHGLGTFFDVGTPPEKVVKIAKVNWGVEKWPLFTRKNKTSELIEVPDQFALSRVTDGKTLSIVGPEYIPTQNVQAFKFFDAFTKSGEATMETAGSLMDGRLVWGLAKLNMEFTIGKNDKVRGYVLLSSPHIQGRAFICKAVAERVVCHNTYTIAMRESGAQFRMTHKHEFTQEMIEEAQKTLGLARDQISKFEENARILKGMKFKENDVIELLAPIVNPRVDVEALKDDFDDEANVVFRKIMGAYHNAPGADPGTGWGVLNGVTYYADHIASRTVDRRLTNSWFGSTGRLKERTMEALLEKAQ